MGREEYRTVMLNAEYIYSIKDNTVNKGTLSNWTQLFRTQLMIEEEQKTISEQGR